MCPDLFTDRKLFSLMISVKEQVTLKPPEHVPQFYLFISVELMISLQFLTVATRWQKRLSYWMYSSSTTLIQIPRGCSTGSRPVEVSLPSSCYITGCCWSYVTWKHPVQDRISLCPGVRTQDRSGPGSSVCPTFPTIIKHFILSLS